MLKELRVRIKLLRAKILISNAKERPGKDSSHPA